MRARDAIIHPPKKKQHKQALVQTPGRNYSSGDYEALLRDLGLPDAADVYRHVFPQYLATLVPPGVCACVRAAV